MDWCSFSRSEPDTDDNKLEFTPTCPRSTYDMQIRAMSDYMAILEGRAVMEGIKL